MPNYAKKKLTKYEYKSPNCLQYCQYESNRVIDGNNSDSIVHESKSPLLDKHEKKYVQQVLGSFLYYMCAIGMTILHALSVIASEQANPRERTLKRVHQLLHYMHTYPTSVICFRSSNMILNAQSDTSCMSTGKG